MATAALGQYEDDPARAVATVEADLDPAARALGFLVLADLAAELDGRVTRGDPLLDRALAEVRCANDPRFKLRLLGEIADRWLDSGRLDRATPLLREGQAVVAGVDGDGWFWEPEQFAEVLAVIYRPAAQAALRAEAMGRGSRSPRRARSPATGARPPGGSPRSTRRGRRGSSAARPAT